MNRQNGAITIVEVDGTSTALGAATTGFTWKLLSAVFSNAAAGSNFKFTSDGVDLTGNTINTANGPVVLVRAEEGWIQGTADKDLTLVGSDALDGWAVVQKIRSDSSAGGFLR